jgi:hypothetical protein
VGREVLSTREQWDNHAQLQGAFNDWRVVYNHQRPHDSLGLATPATRYQPSPRSRPTRIDPPDYPDGVEVRIVNTGRISYRGQLYRVPKAFNGRPLGITPGPDGYDIWYRHQTVITITPTEP